MIEGRGWLAWSFWIILVVVIEKSSIRILGANIIDHDWQTLLNCWTLFSLCHNSTVCCLHVFHLLKFSLRFNFLREEIFDLFLFFFNRVLKFRQFRLISSLYLRICHSLIDSKSDLRSHVYGRALFEEAHRAHTYSFRLYRKPSKYIALSCSWSSSR